MQTLEKNDIDISKLFNWGKEVQLKDVDGNSIFTLYMRVIGDADLNRARVFALRQSAKMRKELHTEDSDLRLAMIPQYEIVESDNLIEYIISAQVTDLASKIVRDLNIPSPVEPDELAPLEAHEKYQLDIDAWPKKREELLNEKITGELDKERERLKGLSRGKLEKSYENYLIDSLCEQEMYKTFSEMRVFYSTYLDEKFEARAFKSFEEVNNLPTELKQQLIVAYLSLDIKIEDLKKLQEATL